MFYNWLVSPAGQQTFADRERVPARPNSKNQELIPRTGGFVRPEMAPKFNGYEKLWNEIVLQR